MHRNTIIAICAGFCAVAVIAGLFVGSLSSASQPIAVAQATPGAVEPSLAPTAGALADAATNTPRATAEVATPTSGVPDEPTSAPAPTDAPAAVAPTAAAAPTAEPAAAPTAEPAAAPGFVEYTVQRGDELLVLAKKYNVSVQDILANNQIANPDSLVVGQVLRIPQK